ncbi:transcriptional regulator [Salinimonas marina]|uniref:Transcriptional regulator n=1 Tax=Salinimonas marina TaxID=2785918 RepID=A0A7S9DZ09_9ALTE|nr:Cro/CI family transcriptional regulator [Salinimonas marina]QPG06533.1 transcriptional regulator [Salinimonas marina]
MTKTQAITFFRSQKALGEAIGKAKSTVSNYSEILPRGVQFEIQVKTQGQLMADPEFYQQPNFQNQHLGS